MAQPFGFTDTQYSSHVYRLQKAIYGLRQSPRAWYHKLRETLLAVGFETLSSDPSLFIFKHSNNIVFLLVYVDDIVLISNN
jgi:Reverse transcriptase (RNA-dependent DNA polymerase)